MGIAAAPVEIEVSPTRQVRRTHSWLSQVATPKLGEPDLFCAVALTTRGATKAIAHQAERTELMTLEPIIYRAFPRTASSGLPVSLVLFAAPAFAQDEQAIGMAVGGVIGLLLVIIIGAIVGWLAGLIVKGSGSGPLGNIAAGIGGSILAGYVLPLLGISIGGTIGGFIAALIGAIALILIVRLIRKAAN